MVARYRPSTNGISAKSGDDREDRAQARSRKRPVTSRKSERVGYGSPPVHSRFATGQSGNPHGRPKNSRNLKTIIQAVLSEKIVVREGEKQRSITKIEGVVLRQIEGALRGNHRAALATLKIAAQVGLLEKAEDAVDELTLTATEQQIIDELLSRSAGKKTRKRK